MERAFGHKFSCELSLTPVRSTPLRNNKQLCDIENMNKTKALYRMFIPFNDSPWHWFGNKNSGGKLSNTPQCWLSDSMTVHSSGELGLLSLFYLKNRGDSLHIQHSLTLNIRPSPVIIIIIIIIFRTYRWQPILVLSFFVSNHSIFQPRPRHATSATPFDNDACLLIDMMQ